MDAIGGFRSNLPAEGVAACRAEPDSTAGMGAALAPAYSDCGHVRFTGSRAAGVEWLLPAVMAWAAGCPSDLGRGVFNSKLAHYGSDRHCSHDADSLFIRVYLKVHLYKMN